MHSLTTFTTSCSTFTTPITPTTTTPRSGAVTKSEQFTLEESQPQATLQSVASSKYVSVMGLDVTANQAEVSDNETFQLEFVAATCKWVLRTVQDKYVSLGAGGGLQAGEVTAAAAAPLELVWLEGGAVALKTDTGKLVTNKKSGHLFATADAVDERSKYFFHLINRPVLVLKGEQGYVGYRAPNSTKLDCNKAIYATFMVEKAEQGQVHLKGEPLPSPGPREQWEVLDRGGGRRGLRQCHPAALPHGAPLPHQGAHQGRRRQVHRGEKERRLQPWRRQQGGGYKV